MPSWLFQIVYVLASSKRAQWCFFLGIFFYFLIIVIGNYSLSNFELSGYMKPLEEVVKSKFANRYDKIALVTMFSFFGLSIKAFFKDRKRLLLN